MNIWYNNAQKSCASLQAFYGLPKGLELGGAGRLDPRVRGTRRAGSTDHLSCARYHGFHNGSQSLVDCGAQIVPDLEPGADHAKLRQIVRDRHVACMDHDLDISTLEQLPWVLQ